MATVDDIEREQKRAFFVKHYPEHTTITGSESAGLLLSRLMVLYSAHKGEEFYHSDSKLTEETGIGRKGLWTARARLEALGLVRTVRRGYKGVNYYQVDGALYLSLFKQAREGLTDFRCFQKKHLKEPKMFPLETSKSLPDVPFGNVKMFPLETSDVPFGNISTSDKREIEEIYIRERQSSEKITPEQPAIVVPVKPEGKAATLATLDSPLENKTALQLAENRKPAKAPAKAPAKVHPEAFGIARAMNASRLHCYPQSLPRSEKEILVDAKQIHGLATRLQSARGHESIEESFTEIRRTIETVYKAPKMQWWRDKTITGFDLQRDYTRIVQQIAQAPRSAADIEGALNFYSRSF